MGRPADKPQAFAKNFSWLPPFLVVRYPDHHLGQAMKKHPSAVQHTHGKTHGLGAAKPVHPYAWLWEAVEQNPSFVLRSMFGAKVVYLHGLMMLCFSAGQEPWRGVLVCTDRTRHAALITDFPSLVPHSVLPKWLYLPESAPDFEASAEKLVAFARQRDPRLGIVPQARKRTKPIRADSKPNRPS